MALRLLKIVVETERGEALRELLDGHPVIARWDDALSDERFEANVLMSADCTEPVMDDLSENFEHGEEFRVVVIDVEATLPRPDEAEENAAKANGAAERISREELYQDVSDSAKPTAVWLTMVALSAVVAAVGLMRDDVAVIIGAMVIAPLLGPNVALSLATTLADGKLARRAAIAVGIGLGIVMAIAVVAGLIFQPAGDVPAIEARSAVSLADVLLALAAGVAGTLAFTTGVSNVLVGVMVAVALLPPMVVCGLMLGAGHFDASIAAGLLVVVNVICINLAGVSTFYARGIRPRTWYEADAAGKATLKAIAAWVVLLAILSGVIGYVYRIAPEQHGGGDTNSPTEIKPR